jgi:hypothetical protein
MYTAMIYAVTLFIPSLRSRRTKRARIMTQAKNPRNVPVLML